MYAPPEWWPNWRGEIVVIVASGPSADKTDLEAGRGKARFIAINRSWELAPWADVLFACDAPWWEQYAGRLEFGGLRVSTSVARMDPAWKVRRLRLPISGPRCLDPVGAMGDRGGSGFQAFHFAVHLLPRRIVLVGYDLTLKHGAHWHGSHEGALRDPNAFKIDRWRRLMDWSARRVRALGIEVVNSSEVSTLTAFRKLPFGECFA